MILFTTQINLLNANPEKWSNTLKQIVGNLPTICLSVFDHFMNLALKELRLEQQFICIAESNQFSFIENRQMFISK